MQISTNAVDEVNTAKELLDLFNRIEEKADKIKGSYHIHEARKRCSRQKRSKRRGSRRSGLIKREAV